MAVILASGIAAAYCPTGSVRGFYDTTEQNLTCTITYQPNAGYGKDADVINYTGNSSWANTNFGYQSYMDMYSWTWGGYPVTYRSLLQFDLSALGNATNITSANLYLYNDGVQPHGAGYMQYANQSSMKITKLASSWNESSVTWNNQPGTTGSDTLVGAPSSLYANFAANVYGDIYSWVHGNVTNNGWRLSLQTESPYRQAAYASSDVNSTAIAPKLVIVYSK